jgi:CRP/FNR family transcriptional regulator, cyclic AMP receptor protein
MIDIHALQKYSLFGGLLPEEIAEIRPLLGAERYGAGEAILTEGKPNAKVHFILQGKVEVEKKGAILASLEEGDTFGEMEFLDVMPAAATVRALEPTELSTLTNRTLHEIFKKNPSAYALMVMNLARDLSRRLRRMDEIVADLHCKDIPVL